MIMIPFSFIFYFYFVGSFCFGFSMIRLNHVQGKGILLGVGRAREGSYL